MTSKKKSRALSNTQQKEIAEKLKDPVNVRNSIHNLIKNKIGTGKIYKDGEEYLNKLFSGEEINEKEKDKLGTIINSINPFQTHKFLLNLIKDEGERHCIMEFAEDIAKEYGCKSTMELSLCETIASSYYSMMIGSQQIQRMYNIEYLSIEKNGYYSMISKEIEKQSRLYMNAMMTLRALKSPFGNVSIRAKNAFIGENQQFNHNPPPEVGENP